MQDLAVIKNEIQNRVRRSFSIELPRLAIWGEIVPRAQLATNLAWTLCAALRRPFHEIAQPFVDEPELAGGGRFEVQGDHLNIVFNPSEVPESFIDSSSVNSPSVIGVPFAVAASPLGRARILARVQLQIAALRGEGAQVGELLVGTQGESLEQWLGRFSALAQRDSTAFLWLHPDSIPRKRLTALSLELRARDVELRVIPVESPEVEGIVESAQYSALEGRSDASRIVYLASPIPGPDIDLEVTSRNERANTYWYLKATGERLSRIVSPIKSGLPTTTEPLVSGRLINTVNILPLLRRAAAEQGLVRSWLEGLLSVATEFCNLMNTPSVRSTIDKIGLNSADLATTSGVIQLLSDTVQSWERYLISNE